MIDPEYLERFHQAVSIRPRRIQLETAIVGSSIVVRDSRSYAFTIGCLQHMGLLGCAAVPIILIHGALLPIVQESLADYSRLPDAAAWFLTMLLLSGLLWGIIRSRSAYSVKRRFFAVNVDSGMVSSFVDGEETGPIVDVNEIDYISVCHTIEPPENSLMSYIYVKDLGGVEIPVVDVQLGRRHSDSAGVILGVLCARPVIREDAKGCKSTLFLPSDHGG